MGTESLWCQHKINRAEMCSLNARIKLTRPQVVEPKEPPLFVCYSHLTSFVKNNTGPFLVEKVK